MSATTKSSHTGNYFSSIRKFYPYAALENHPNKEGDSLKKGQKKATKRDPHTYLCRGHVPEAIHCFLETAFFGLKKLVLSGQDPSCPLYLQRSKSAVLVYEDSEIEAAANTSEFIELLTFYDDPPEMKADSVIARINNHTENWYILSASTPEGAPIITNYVIQAVDLIQFIKLLTQDVTRPVQELLAYRTANLYDALILACSKPF
jgi:hypothetical protein